MIDTKQKILNLLGLAMRANQMITGEELSIKSIKQNKARLIFIAQDTGNATRTKVENKCKYYEVPFYDGLTKEELSQAIGKPRTIIAISDAGFAKKLKVLISEIGV